jgi:hypothetical protein
MQRNLPFILVCIVKRTATIIFLKFRVYWDVAPCSHVEVDRHFRSAYCLNHEGYIPEDSKLHTHCHEMPHVAQSVILCGAQTTWWTNIQCGLILLFINDKYIILKFYEKDFSVLKICSLLVKMCVHCIFNYNILKPDVHVHQYYRKWFFQTCVKVFQTSIAIRFLL